MASSESDARPGGLKPTKREATQWLTTSHSQNHGTIKETSAGPTEVFGRVQTPQRSKGSEEVGVIIAELDL